MLTLARRASHFKTRKVSQLQVGFNEIGLQHPFNTVIPNKMEALLSEGSTLSVQTGKLLLRVSGSSRATMQRLAIQQSIANARGLLNALESASRLSDAPSPSVAAHAAPSQSAVHIAFVDDDSDFRPDPAFLGVCSTEASRGSGCSVSRKLITHLMQASESGSEDDGDVEDLLLISVRLTEAECLEVVRSIPLLIKQYMPEPPTTSGMEIMEPESPGFRRDEQVT